MAEKKTGHTDHKAVTLAALKATQASVDEGLASLPDEGGHEPPFVKGARSVLGGCAKNLKAEIAELEG